MRKVTAWPSRWDASLDSLAMKMENVEGQLEVGAGVGAFGNDGGHHIKTVGLGGGDGGVNGDDRVCGAGSGNEQQGLGSWDCEGLG